MKKIILTIKGMHCPSCEALIKDVLEDEKGIIKSDVSKDKAYIEFDESIIKADKIKSLIENEGYEVK